MQGAGNADADVVNGTWTFAAAATGLVEEHGAGMDVLVAHYRDDIYTCIIYKCIIEDISIATVVAYT